VTTGWTVAAGIYDLLVVSNGRATMVMNAVPVVSTTPTTVSTVTLPITPPLSVAPLRVVTGTVTPATATVRVLQVLSGGPTVEVAWAPVDALTGAFTTALTPSAPLKLAYVPNPVSLPFVSDNAVAGQYTVEARSAGLVQTRLINTTVPVPPLVFSF
jgi:hypothetical protein